MGKYFKNPYWTLDSKGRFLDMEDQGICLVIAAKNVGKYMCFFIKGTGLF